jgi:hypothetical protein
LKRCGLVINESNARCFNVESSRGLDEEK